jgi:hypothetical protein
MWNPEARDSSPIIFTVMSSWKGPRHRRCHGRRSLWKRAAAGLVELELEPWVSLWSNHFGEESTPPLAWWSDGAEKFTAVEDFARYSVEDAQDAAAAGKEGDKEGSRCRGGGDKR